MAASFGLAKTNKKANTAFILKLSSNLYACFEGLVLPTLVDPDFDLEGAYRVLGQIAKQFVQSQLTSEGK
ncbi:MAG: hypothetical protein BSOLF_1228 [Candidatus Carbobacillus altaicus]|uniref:Uncharacterized protein n=1 Tax=Candidatus Carbonibacillus altaicus TaxID=2163959 RepID=A0A2R6XZQ9_9BACL|nr:MAG: hypothetical protein BSOLF_1228 [Candidatus Carbobacillus altaicus]